MGDRVMQPTWRAPKQGERARLHIVRLGAFRSLCGTEIAFRSAPVPVDLRHPSACPSCVAEARRSPEEPA